MKLATTLALAVALALATTASADTAHDWTRVRRALSKDLPRTALGPVRRILLDARRRQDWPEAVRAASLEVAIEARIEGNRPEEKVRRMQAAIERSPAPMGPVLEAILAEWAWQYFQRNRWRIVSRTPAPDAGDGDLTTWDLPRLYREIDRRFARALAARELLLATPAASYDSLLAPGNAPDRYRPTLYDVIAFEALAFYASGEQAGARPEDSFVLRADDPVFAPREVFVQWTPATTDTAAALLRAVRLYQDLLRTHAADRDPSARIDADLWRLEFARGHAVGPDRDARYRTALERLIERDGGHELSARAAHALASLRREQDDLTAAHELARAAYDRFPESIGGRRCFNLLREIEAPSLGVEVSDRVWNAPSPTISVRYRNLDRVCFRLVPFDPLRVECLSSPDLDSVLRMPVAREWSAPLPETRDYRERTERLPVPAGLAPGAYCLVSSARPDFARPENSLGMTVVWVSDLAVVLREGRPTGGEGFVLSAADGAPVAGADVRTWLWAHDRCVPGPSARTDTNGVFRLQAEPVVHHMFVSRGDRRLGLDWAAPYHGREATAPVERTLFFTDRAIYRPGQTISYKGLAVVLDQERDDYAVLADRDVTVALLDQNGREMGREQHRSNRFGSFSGIFTAPAVGLRGRLQLTVRSGPSGAAEIRVEEYERPRFVVAIGAPRAPARLGDSVEVVGRALSYTGAPVDGARVAWRVVREVRYPSWRSWRLGPAAFPASARQPIAHGTATTDAEGRFVVLFAALPDVAVPAEQEPVFRYSISADVTDGTGETRSAAGSVQVGYAALSAALSASDWQQAGRPVRVEARTATLDGAAREANGTLTVLRLRGPTRLTRAAEAAGGFWDRADSASGAAHPQDPATWPEDGVVLRRGVRTDSAGRASVAIPLGAGAYLVRYEARDPFGRIVTALLPVLVIDPGATRCALRVRDLFVPRATKVEPGGEFLAVWGTGYDSARAFIEVERRGRLLRAWWTAPARTQVAIRVPVDETMRGGFTVRVTRVAENRAYLHEQVVEVPWSNKVLDVRWERFVSKLVPGGRETWTAVVRGPGGTRAAAEMVATLYDASLDAFAKLAWDGFRGFRTTGDRRRPTSFGGPVGLDPEGDGWTRASRDASLTYRHLPEGLIRGDRAFGVELETIEVSAQKRISVHLLRSGTLGGQGLNFRGGRAGQVAFEVEPALETPVAEVMARRDLRETAFFLPHLATDADGAIRIEFDVPEALTSWRFLAFAHDARLRSGRLEATAVTATDLMVQPNPPRFLREGDEVEFTVKVTNRTDRAQRGRVELRLARAEDGSPADSSLGNREPERPFEVPPRTSRTYGWRLRVPDGTGVLTYRAAAAAERLADGEEGWVPVLSRRVLVTESLPLPIRGPGSRSFDFAGLRRSHESPSLQHQALTVQMASNPAWYAVMALPYLIECPHEGSEQTFDRLYANALARHVAESDPRIRAVFDRWRGTAALDSPLEKNPALRSVLIEEMPWVREARAGARARRDVGVLFDRARLDAETAVALRRLESMQLPGGVWPWFPGGPADDHVTIGIVAGFGRLRHLGVDLTTPAVLRALDRLDDWADERRREILARNGAERRNQLSPTIALYLYGRSFFLGDRPVTARRRPALDFWLAQARHHWPDVPDRQVRGHLALALQRFGDRGAARAILRSVREHAVHDDEMGTSWADPEPSWWWWRAPIETQAVMIEAFDEVMADSAMVEGCRTWLLKQKQTQDWRTTRATADAVYALLLRGANPLASEASVRVSLGGVPVDPSRTEAGTGFYEERVEGTAIRPSMARVTVEKEDPGIAWGGVHWQYFEDLARVRPSAPGTPLQIEKSLYVSSNGRAGPELRPVTGPVRVGDEIVARIRLRADRDVEYVHLKDARGSGLEPMRVLSGWRVQDGLGYYEEIRDAATNIFIDRLPKGTYVLEIPVRAELRGRYSSGIAEIQCLYAPEFNAHSAAVPLVVE